MKLQVLKFLLFWLIFTALGLPHLFAGTTGKIVGKVTDEKTGEPLPGVNVIIDGTLMGAATDLEGNYLILHVPPGIHTLKASMMGYKPVRFEKVRVSIDLTTTINFALVSEVLDLGAEITVVAERPLVTKDLTATTAVVGAEEIASLPVTEVNDAIELQAGLIKDAGGGFHIRGGRSGEISFWVDGMPVTDVYDGGVVVNVNKDMVQELQVISGAFNAEYGQAMSGIVNIATKTGSNQFGGSLTTYLGDHLSQHTNEFMNIDQFKPTAIHNFDASLHGALVKDKLFFYVNSRYIYFDGWLFGQRKFNPNAVTAQFQRLPTSLIKQYFPDYLSESQLVDPKNDLRSFLYVLGTNPVADSGFVSDYLDVKDIDPDSFSYYYSRFLENHKNGKGDGKYVPMNWNRKFYNQAKLIFRPIPALSFSYNFIYDDFHYQEWGIDGERNYKYNPDGAPKKFSLGLTHIAKMTHMLTSRTFYELGLSYFTKEYEKYVYENPQDARYVHPDFGIQQPYSYKSGGTDNSRFNRKTTTFLGKLDLTSQISNTHQIKTGIEFRKHEVYRRDVTLRPIQRQSAVDYLFDSPYISTRILPDSTIYASQYTHRPTELSAYIQDKMEFRNMIVNVGLRVDYFEPDGVILNDESDPSIYNPIRPENRYRDWGRDGQPNTNDPDGTEGNGIRDPGEPLVTRAEREQYWYKSASDKLQVSPRLGVSFPITERGAIHFSYGHFFQLPRFERLYQNPDFELGSGTGNVGVIGNADLKPEQTVSGEIGLQQAVTEDIFLSITGYFRDIRNLTGTRAEEIVIFGGSAKYSKFQNSDFGIIKGLILALDKRFSGGFSTSMDYTLQLAKGSNSDPEQARNALSGGALPEVQLTPLDWDQKHTVNATLTYAATGWGGSLIAQWGSGLPYTPRKSEDITALLTNSQRKPASFNVDLRAYKEFQFGPGNFTVFLRIFNLFDNLNELSVYDDTGRAGFTLDENTARATNPTELLNNLDDWFINPTHYAEPRRVEFGFTYIF